MYQPKFPLRFSELDGAYQSIKDLKESVKQNAKTLLNISPGEWPANPELGVGLRNFLFSNYPSPELDNLHQRIREQFSRYMPFLDIRSEFVELDVNNDSLINHNEIKLIVRYNITPIAEQDLLTLTLGENVQ